VFCGCVRVLDGMGLVRVVAFARCDGPTQGRSSYCNCLFVATTRLWPFPDTLGISKSEFEVDPKGVPSDLDESEASQAVDRCSTNSPVGTEMFCLSRVLLSGFYTSLPDGNDKSVQSVRNYASERELGGCATRSALFGRATHSVLFVYSYLFGAPLGINSSQFEDG
jgi:hypothetical protein